MTQEMIQQVESLHTLIGALYSNQTIKVTKDEVNRIGELYKQITSKRRINLACAECVRNALAVIAVWYEDNKPKEEKKTKTTNNKK